MGYTTHYMNRILGYILAIIVLAGIAYAIYSYAPRAPEVPVPSTNGADAATADQMQTNIITDSTATYTIDARYPQFGISAVDAKIKAVVDKAVAEFKTYPANPPDSAVQQNEFTSSFSDVYVGEDVVSVALVISEYTGGAHPNTVIIGVNVNRASGQELTLTDALALIGKSLEEVATQSLAELKATLGEDVIFADGAAPKPENYGTFLVSKDRVTFVFNNYQVAPYASGQQKVWFSRVK